MATVHRAIQPRMLAVVGVVAAVERGNAVDANNLIEVVVTHFRVTHHPPWVTTTDTHQCLSQLRLLERCGCGCGCYYPLRNDLQRVVLPHHQRCSP